MGMGSGLGVARGYLEIDTRGMDRAETLSRSVGANVARNFGQVDASINRTVGGVNRLNQSLGGLIGGFAVQRIAQFALEADKTATAYARQSVAAEHLAGSQQQLNELLEAYDDATGHAVAQAESMAEVTRLQAIGFADSAAELDEFVTAARGAALAMGRSQDYIISQLQLAIANQSKLRLDQIGLGIAEVDARIAKLKASDKGLTDEMIYQNAVLGLLQEKFGGLVKSQEAQATGAEKMARAWKDASLEIGQAFGPAIGAVLEGAANQTRAIADNLTDAANSATRIGQGLRRDMGQQGPAKLTGNPLVDYLFHGTDPLGDWLRTHELGTKEGEGLYFNERRNYDRYSASAGGTYPGGPGWGMSRPMAPAEDPRADERRQAQLDFSREIADIERSANAQRLDATRAYESQRAEAIEQYGRSIVREEEDFLRQRGRAVAAFNRSVIELQSAAAERDQEWAADLAERIADIQNDGNERISDIEENYQRDRERREQDHRDRLFDAAGRLDAVAVAEEQRNYRRQSQDAQERHSEQIDKERENIAERISEEQKGHAERLAEAREADAERLADMRRDFAERTAQEDEDRATRLQRMAEDHASQLAQMDAAQALRIEQINRHEAEQRKAAEDAHLTEMEALGVTLSKGWSTVQKLLQEQMLKDYEQFKKDLEDRYKSFKNVQGGAGGGDNPQTMIPAYANGGWVGRTGPALVHQGEYIISRQMMAMGMGGINVGGINIYGATDPVAVANEIDQRLRYLFQQMRT